MPVFTPFPSAGLLNQSRYFCAQLFRRGQISYSRLAILKSKYQNASEALKKKRQRCQTAVTVIRRQNEDIDALRREAKKAARMPENARQECERHRRDLAKIHGNLVESRSRQDQLESEITE